MRAGRRQVRLKSSLRRPQQFLDLIGDSIGAGHAVHIA